MKIFSIKRLLGLAAIYGAVQYARKHGGAKNAFNSLLDKAKGFAGDIKDEVSSVVSDSSSDVGAAPASSYGTSGIGSRAAASDVEGYGTGSSGGVGGLGGNGRRGY